MAESTASAPVQGPIPRAIAWALARKPVRAFLLYGEHRGPLLADSITYRTLFSVFAAVLLGFSVAGLWLSENPAAFQTLVDAVDRAVPGLVGEGGIIDPSALRAPNVFTIAGIIALVGLLGAAIGAIGSLRTALRVIADQVFDDTLIVWVLLRNLLVAIAFGALLAASAVATFLGTAGVGWVTQLLGLSSDSFAAVFGTRVVIIAAVFALDAVAVAGLFRALSGAKASPRALWSGALLGGVGLTVLQQLSGLFVGSAAKNPAFGVFAGLIALLLWFNLSSQVILIASAYIVTGVAEERDRVRERFGAMTFAQRRVRRAEDAVRVATDELEAARTAEEKERGVS